MTTYDLKKKIKVVEYWLSSKGLEVHYTLNGNDHSIIANPQQAADLFKKIGLIEDYCGSDNDVSVEVEFTDQGCTQMYWSDFVSEFTFSQSDAIDVAVQVESEKSLRSNVHPLFEDIFSKFGFGNTKASLQQY